MSFGPDTKDIITLNLLSEESTTFIDFAALVKMFLCISLFFSYPIMMFPVTRMLQRKCAGFSQMSATNNNQSTLKMLPMFIRLILVTISGLIVCIVPNFSDLMNIIGAVFGTILAFIMPELCHYAIFRTNIQRSDLIMDVMLILIGCLGCILGVIEALNDDNSEVANILTDAGETGVIQRQVFQTNVHYNNSDNLPPIVHSSTSDTNVIKNSVPVNGVADAIEKTISVASAAVTEKLSSVMSKVGHSSTTDVLS